MREQRRARDGRQPAHDRALRPVRTRSSVWSSISSSRRRRRRRAGVLGGVLDQPVIARPAQRHPTTRPRPRDRSHRAGDRARARDSDTSPVGRRAQSPAGSAGEPPQPAAQPTVAGPRRRVARARQRRRARRNPRLRTQVAQPPPAKYPATSRCEPRNVAAPRSGRRARAARALRDRAPRCHPSVRGVSAATVASSPEPGTAANSCCASAAVNASSSAPISTSCPGAQPREPHRRDGARDQHELHVRRQRRDRVVERAQAARVVDRLHVVDHENVGRSSASSPIASASIPGRATPAGSRSSSRASLPAPDGLARPPWRPPTTAG